MLSQTRRTGAYEGVEATPVPARALQQGDRVGRYVVLETIGAGGMGVVCRAYDPKLGREVALKFLRTAGSTHLDPKAQARLWREAQTMARLSHPNVLPVYDIDESEFGVFIAMEFVPGSHLRQWLEQEDRPWAEVLDRFVAAGRGLAAAHAAGLVHRDFKPTNVLVGRDDRVRVLDFGLARLVDEPQTDEDDLMMTSDADRLGDSLTRTGIVMGTPAFMAPEQHRGRAADARSDQYGFCVALFEALYGTRPFAGPNVEVMAKAKASGKFAVVKQRRGPSHVYAAIVRGLSPDPADRFPSMDLLLRALVRDRYRTPRRIAGALTLVAMVGGASLIGGRSPEPCSQSDTRLFGIWDGERRDAVSAALQAIETPYAARTAGDVTAALDRYAQAWTAGHRDACEATHVRHEQSTDLLDLRMSCLESRRQQLRAWTELLTTPDETLSRRAVQGTRSLPAVERCEDVAALLARTPLPQDPDTRTEIERIRRELAEAYALETAGRYEDASARARPMTAAAEATGYDPIVAEAWFRLASVRDMAGDYAEAADGMERSYWAALASSYDDYMSLAARALVYQVGSRLARYDEGLQWAKHAEAATKRVGAGGKPQADLHSMIGTVLMRKGEFREAQAHHEQALAILEAMDPVDELWVATTRIDLGNTLFRLRDYAAASVQFEQAVQMRRQAYGDDHPMVAMVLSNYGSALFVSGNVEKGRETLERALDIRTRSLGPDHPGTGRDVHNLGNVSFDLGDYDAALTYYQRSKRIKAKAYGADHPTVAVELVGVGRALFRLERIAEAEAAIEEALAILGDREETRRERTEAFAHRADAWLRLERWDAARTDFKAALATLNTSPDPLAAQVFDYEVGLGRALLETGEVEAAAALLDTAIARGEPDPTASRSRLAMAHFDHARAWWRLGRRKAAREEAVAALPTASDETRPAIEAWLAEHRL